jgi:hypothetical protein
MPVEHTPSCICSIGAQRTDMGFLVIFALYYATFMWRNIIENNKKKSICGLSRMQLVFVWNWLMHISSFSGSLSPFLSSSSRDACDFVSISTIPVSFQGLTWLWSIVYGEARCNIWNNGSDEWVEQMSWKYVIILTCTTDRILPGGPGQCANKTTTI